LGIGDPALAVSTHAVPEKRNVRPTARVSWRTVEAWRLQWILDMEPSHSHAVGRSASLGDEPVGDAPPADAAEFASAEQTEHVAAESPSGQARVRSDAARVAEVPTGKQPVPEPETAIVARSPFKLWLGVLLGVVAAILAIGAFVFIWFGVFPSVLVMLLCMPIALLASRLIKNSRPVRTTNLKS
jgi:hypothetical protein